jgi:hypothetical protein
MKLVSDGHPRFRGGLQRYYQRARLDLDVFNLLSVRFIGSVVPDDLLLHVELRRYALKM